MRLGQNPNKQANAVNYAPVILAVITHLPSLETPYHAQRLEIVQTCIRTMRAGAGQDCMLAVWDNGSCSELRHWLQYELAPDTLILSQNVGKTSARTSLFRMFPPDRIVAYSDDDMLFFDNWLAPQMDLLENFPNVACVSGYPVRTAFRWGCKNTKAWARSTEGAKLTAGTFIKREWEDDFALSVGRTPEYQKIYTEEDIDYLITYNGRKALATSHHCQFIARAGLVGSIIQFDGLAMAAERSFDEYMDTLGLRLCTTERLCRHIGNVMDDSIRADLQSMKTVTV